MSGSDINLNASMGCVLIGALFSYILYGCSFCQTLYYYHAYPQDRVFLKVIVAVLCHLRVLDTAKFGCDMGKATEAVIVIPRASYNRSQYLMSWLVQGHANVVNTNSIPRAFTTEYLLQGVITMVVQCYYIKIIWTLWAQKPIQKPLCITAIILTIAAFAGCVGTTYILVVTHKISTAVPRLFDPTLLQRIAAVGADVLITAALCYILGCQRDMQKRTRNTMSMLIRFAVQRGILTAFIQTAHVIMYSCTSRESSMLWMLTDIPCSDVYVSSLLTILNVRHQLRAGLVVCRETDITLGGFHFSRCTHEDDDTNTQRIAGSIP
ncbi:hypothetical protein WOLCODRAFT_142632 [Wolfiporia cocos MD-104 SS10]|uniref:DUF6534 domain-containing protein n=1 Tax=Wolfiporia cocos (strain MD-104) TaxID=742152 RepID=A0A2H3J8J3_WOLCO|nr:hypothetical protein WOLCODRAFT_142632 [Wolfiporia cocos MD-104 SS10]